MATKINESLQIGKYHFNTRKLDTIDLYKDHTYSHKYVNTKGKVFECHGKWRYNSKEILFHYFNFFNDLGPSGGSGVWISRITQDDKKIKLNYSDDDDTTNLCPFSFATVCLVLNTIMTRKKQSRWNSEFCKLKLLRKAAGEVF